MKLSSKGNNIIFNIRDLGILIFTLLIFFPAFYQVFVMVFGGVGYYSIVISVSMIVALSKRKNKFDTNIQKQILCFFIFALQFIILNQFFIQQNSRHTLYGINIVVVQMIEIMFAVIMYSYVNYNGKYDKKILYILVISFLITSIITVKELGINFNASKEMATSEGYQGAIGVMGYNIVYSIVILMPIVLYSINKLKGVKKIFVTLLYFYLAFMVYKTGYFTATVVMCLGVAIYIILKSKLLYKILLTPVIAFGLISLLDKTMIYEILMNLSNSIDIQQISQRIEQMAVFILVGEKGAALLRLDLYKLSIDAFLQNIIVGNAIYNKGILLSMHSVILDILGSGGLVHLIPYLFFIFYSYKYTESICIDKKCKNAVICSYISFIIIALINTINSNSTITVSLICIIPMVIRCIKKECEIRESIVVN